MDSAMTAYAGLPAIYFDYSDLLLYFRHNRFPTGIQRVQIELFKASLAWPGPPALRPCAFSTNASFWVDVDVLGFRRLCDLSSKPGSRSDLAWQAAATSFYSRFDAQKPCSFPLGSALLVAGPTWWIANYMPLIREAKALYGIRYIPLLYDFIPMLAPELVDYNVAPAFNSWIGSVFLHADLLTTISACTRDDAVRTMGERHQLVHAPVVTPLDAEFGSKGELPPPEQRQRLLSRFGLTSAGFVLFVGTLEVRKNHRLVFQAWSWLLEQGGDMPTLVCVGKQGWGFESALSVLNSRPGLSDKVLMLSGISDLELRTLYNDCLFTVYASLYEGWGLPVTESLCFGKACLTANVSSLPEAGGRFADYYEFQSVSSFVDGARRLIFDHTYRKSRETLIAMEFRPRRWADVLAGLVIGIVRCFPTPANAEPLVPDLKPGRIYDLISRPDLTRPNRHAAQAEMLCVGQDWFALEHWGVWSRQPRARLAFQIPVTSLEDDLVVQIRVRSAEEHIKLKAWVASHILETTSLLAHERRLLTLLIPAEVVTEFRKQQRPMTISLEVDHLVHLLAYTLGDDRRVGIGVEFLAIHWRTDLKSKLGIFEHYLGMIAHVEHGSRVKPD